MELNIDHLRLVLPPALADRADAIGRALGDALARLPLTHAGHLAHLSLPPLTVEPGDTNETIARNIARAVHLRLQGEQ